MVSENFKFSKFQRIQDFLKFSETTKSSIQAHSRKEGNHRIVSTTEVPNSTLLKDSLIANSMHTQDSIQARLGGDSLPATIPDLNPGITNLSDLVAMKKHTGDTISASLHQGIVFLPLTLAVADSSIHLTFDLAGHVKEKSWFEVWRADRVAVPSTSLRYDIQGAIAIPPVPLLKLSHVVAEVTFLLSIPPDSI